MKDNSEWIGYGVIKGIVDYDNATRYYVNINVNGRDIVAHSVHYIYQKKRFYDGETVRVRCFGINNGTVMCEILDDELISCSEAVKRDRLKYIIFGINNSSIYI